jgi:hypothetical protein
MCDKIENENHQQQRQSQQDSLVTVKEEETRSHTRLINLEYGAIFQEVKQSASIIY